MRRKTTKDVIKSNVPGLVLGIVFILAGLLLPFVSLIPPTPYEAMQEKTAIVDHVRKHLVSIGLHSSKITWTLYTKDGERFNLTGSFEASSIQENLREYDEVKIVYDESWLGNLIGLKYAEEVTINGRRVVAYDNDEEQNWVILYVLAGVSLLTGLLIIFVIRWDIKRNQTQQQKRDLRIKKKYGDK